MQSYKNQVFLERIVGENEAPRLAEPPNQLGATSRPELSSANDPEIGPVLKTIA